jgi:hypothetical protein
MRRYLSKSWFLLHLILVFSTPRCHKKDPVRPVESAPVLPFRIQFPGWAPTGSRPFPRERPRLFPRLDELFRRGPLRPLAHREPTGGLNALGVLGRPRRELER